MKKFLVCGAAAVALAGLAPAIAQDTQTAPRSEAAPRAAKAEKAHTRADVQAKIGKYFARVDTNRDGFVTREEMQAATQALHARIQQRAGSRGARVFDRLDSNRDGSISREEFDAARTQRMAHRPERGDGAKRPVGAHRMGMLGGRMFEMADSNSDGRVSLQEAQAAALRHFDMADANRDGRVTRDERRQMRQRMINERRPG